MSERIFYQFFSLNYNVEELRQWLPFLEFMGYNAVYLTPVFKSTVHGYDTEDFKQIDPRIGNNDEFKEFVKSYQSAGIQVVIDGVFNHVGRNFWAFQDVLENGCSSKYWGWFKDLKMWDDEGVSEKPRSKKYFPLEPVDYEGWEGNFDLVLLDHDCPELVDYLMECIHFWIDDLGVDGIRLDVAYSLPTPFLQRMRSEVGPDYYLLGEQIHGDYNRLLDAGLTSVTDYNLYKGIWSSIKESNLFEANWTLTKHQEDYPDKKFLTFVDNHDTDRVASHFVNEDGELDLYKLKKTYEFLFLLPGEPCVFYGSEFAIEDSRMRTLRRDGQADADAQIRVKVDPPSAENYSNELSEHIRGIISKKKEVAALHSTNYKALNITNTSVEFERGDQVFTLEI